MPHPKRSRISIAQDHLLKLSIAQQRQAIKIQQLESRIETLEVSLNRSLPTPPITPSAH